MNRTLFFFSLFLFSFCRILAAGVTGTVTDDKGNILAFASVFVKGTTVGVTANQQGKYTLDLSPGSYTIVCQFVGYERQEKKVGIVAGEPTPILNFSLSLQQLSLAE